MELSFYDIFAVIVTVVHALAPNVNAESLLRQTFYSPIIIPISLVNKKIDFDMNDSSMQLAT